MILKGSTKKFDMIICTEVNLKNEINNFNLTNYDKYQKLRIGKNGGGIIVYCRKYLDVEIMDCDMKEAETLKMKVTKDNKEIIVIAIYRPPNSNSLKFIKELQKEMKIESKKNTCIIGDMNVDMMDTNNMTERMMNGMTKNGFF